MRGVRGVRSVRGVGDARPFLEEASNHLETPAHSAGLPLHTIAVNKYTLRSTQVNRCIYTCTCTSLTGFQFIFLQ